MSKFKLVEIVKECAFCKKRIEGPHGVYKGEKICGDCMEEIRLFFFYE